MSIYLFMGVLFLTLVNRNSTNIRNFSNFIIIIIITAIITPIFLGIFLDSLIFDRFTNLNQNSTPRFFHFEEALRVSLENPIFGLGGGGYANYYRIIEPGSFTHSGFLESLVSFGFIGLFIYCMIYFEYILFLIKNLKNNNISGYIFILNFISIIGFILYDFLYVSYLATEFLPILVLFRLHLGFVTKKMSANNISYR